jgi:hypothetical protein
MRIYTVTCRGRPFAVVRASDPEEAVGAALALALAPGNIPAASLATREPDDAEMVSWLEQRDDFLLTPEPASAS